MQADMIKSATIMLIFILVLFSCKEKEKKHVENPAKTAKPAEEKKTKEDIRNCIPDDTAIINTGASVRYVVIDSFFAVKLSINSIDTLLDYRFDCSAPSGLVPDLKIFYKDKMCLVRGYGQHYREYVIAYLENGKMMVRFYETALAENIKRDIVVYQNPDSPKNIVIENFKTGNRRIIVLSDNFDSWRIINSDIKNNILQLDFADGKIFKSTIRDL